MQQIDQSILFFINGLHNRFFDIFFWYGTNMLTYLPFYVLLIWLLYKQFGKKIWIPLLFVALLVLFTDQTTNLLKNSICRLRPTHNPDIAPYLHIINNYRGGNYGFPSGHACNTFGMAVFLFHILQPRRWWLTLSLFVWAGIMSYSRMYLGVHYPGDIVVGAILGTLFGLIMSWAVLKTTQKFQQNVT